MNLPIALLGVAGLLGQAPEPEAAPPPERVVLIGGTLIERDQSFGYLETRRTRRFPDRSITFRNLGWSGDTVEGPSRARFGTPADGFKHLVDHVLELRPTEIIIGYGGVEAFAGPPGLPAFRKGLDRLLEALEPTRARVVFLGPTRQEDLGPPLPDPSRHNADLLLYRQALLDARQARWKTKGVVDYFVDLYEALPDGARANPRRPLTDNGIHFNAYGYWRMAAAVEAGLGPNPGPWRVTVDRKGLTDPGIVSMVSFGTKETRPPEAVPGGLRFSVLGMVLPAPPPPGTGTGLPDDARVVRAYNLEPGRYTLKVDGQAVATADAGAWKDGVTLTKGPEFDQVEALRSAIIAKNELYFHRWRPQNETYLFGFRKHEQGRNAREIVEFDPLIAAREAEIARLRVPVPHVYELTREGEVGR